MILEKLKELIKSSIKKTTKKYLYFEYRWFDVVKYVYTDDKKYVWEKNIYTPFLISINEVKKYLDIN